MDAPGPQGSEPEPGPHIALHPRGNLSLNAVNEIPQPTTPV